jgi:TorA maturation chaperone TorD
MELVRALGALAEPPNAGTGAVARALEIEATVPDESQYTGLFVLQLAPYASVYVGAEGMIGGEGQDRVAGFWRALGLDPPPEPDHLATLLGLYARLCEAPQPVRARAPKALLWEHLLSWLPAYLDQVEALDPGFYASWARLLRATLLTEAELQGRPDVLPLHLRSALDGVPRPEREGAEAFVAALLTPVRSGMIVTRADLARCARELGLGVRAGERRFALSALIAQEPRATLAWLAEEAGRWARRHRSRPPALSQVSEYWARRAEATASLLGALAA